MGIKLTSNKPVAPNLAPNDLSASAHKARGRALVPDGTVLRDLSPITDALVALHGSAASTQAQNFSALA